MNQQRLKNRNRIVHWYRIALVGMMVCLFFVRSFCASAATKDTKKPSLTVTVSSQEYVKTLDIKIKATDASGIKTVKYSDSYQKTSYFKQNGIELPINQKEIILSIDCNGTYTFYTMDNAGNTKIKRIVVDQIDDTAPILDLSSSVKNQVATIQVGVADLESGISKVTYLKGNISAADQRWEKAKDITGLSEFQVTESGDYTIKAVDEAGNETISVIHITMELKAVWISYLEFSSKGYTKDEFTRYINTMFDRVVSLNMNAVIVQVRPFGDAMYPSAYFPWSKYISGNQGTNPGFDPLKLMIDAAHSRGLEFHAWLNPYRITTASTDIKLLASSNPARKWLTDQSSANDRNVLSFGGNLYYNPASYQVRKLIVDGVTEIVSNYDVDGIHFDDYFYPTLGKDYATLFDAPEYQAYVEKQKAAGSTVKSIANWRRANVNLLVKSVYQAIKEIDSSVSFGISPHGNIDNLTNDEKYYVDVATWLSKDGYIDYICPQLYWTFGHSTCPFDGLLNQWIRLRKNDQVRIYVGIATYRAGSTIEPQWKQTTVLSDMVTYSRNTGKVDGFMFFRYAHFQDRTCLPAVNDLILTIKKR